MDYSRLCKFGDECNKFKEQKCKYKHIKEEQKVIKPKPDEGGPSIVNQNPPPSIVINQNPPPSIVINQNPQEEEKKKEIAKVNQKPVKKDGPEEEKKDKSGQMINKPA